MNLSTSFYNSHSESKFGFVEKLFVWSLVLEPMIYFVIFSSSSIGISGNISRIMQIIVLFLISIRSLFGGYHKIKIPNIFHSSYRWFFLYLFFTIISLIYGALSGAFDSKIISGTTGDIFSNFVVFLTSNLIRPIIELLVLIYSFLYLVILPQYLLKSDRGINYFFKIFFFVFFLSFFVGLIDYALVYFFQIEWIPRTIADGSHVGDRYHGLAGEPRDAFVFTILGMTLLYVRDYWQETKINKIWYIILSLCLFLTQSMSGYVGLVIILGLLFIFFIPRLKLIYFLPFILITSILLTITIFAILNSPRIVRYIEYAPEVLETLQVNRDISAFLQTQIVNIYPIWIRFVDLTNLNFLPVLIGTGLGSSSILNSIFFESKGGIFSPHANIIRIVFEGGIIGILLYIQSFFSPIARLKVSDSVKSILIICVLSVLGASLGHRSSSIFIFLGITLLVFNFKKTNN